MDITLGTTHYNLSGGAETAIILLVLWSLFWKGWALWRAARKNERAWFIVLLVINSVGILDIAYIFFFSKSKPAKASAE